MIRVTTIDPGKTQAEEAEEYYVTVSNAVFQDCALVLRAIGTLRLDIPFDILIG